LIQTADKGDIDTYPGFDDADNNEELPFESLVLAVAGCITGVTGETPAKSTDA